MLLLLGPPSITIAQLADRLQHLTGMYIHLSATSFLRAAYESKGKGCRTVAAQQPTDHAYGSSTTRTGARS
jgi:hypothetical protein